MERCDDQKMQIILTSGLLGHFCAYAFNCKYAVWCGLQSPENSTCRSGCRRRAEVTAGWTEVTSPGSNGPARSRAAARSSASPWPGSTYSSGTTCPALSTRPPSTTSCARNSSRSTTVVGAGLAVSQTVQQGRNTELLDLTALCVLFPHRKQVLPHCSFTDSV